MTIQLLDPWQTVLNVPCWWPLAWATILNYGEEFNDMVLITVRENQEIFLRKPNRS